MTRHAFDAVSFAFGALFLIAGVMLLSGKPNTDALEWVGPAAAIGLGVVILVATVPRRRADTADEAADEEPMGDASEA
jgi:cytochrome c-type biogenesis protein CcmH/NrfF